MYLRVSLDATGEQLAVTRQREDCRKIAEKHGWEIVDEYVDNSLSAFSRNANRPAYNRMEQDYQDGKFDALICWDLDRLTRQPGQLERWLESAEDHGLEIATVNEEFNVQSPGGRMALRFKASAARAEIEQKSARQKRAAQQRAEQGKFSTGPKPIGYNPDGTVNPEQAEAVRRVYELFLGGESIKGIVRLMEADGHPWKHGTIRRILMNPKYAGLSYYRGERVGRGEWEAIVPEEQFDAVQAVLSDPRRKNNHTGYARKYLGSGLYRCGKCGGRVRASDMRGHARYRCCVYRAAFPIDEYVVAVTRTRLAAPDLSKLLYRAPDEAHMNELRAERDKIQSQMQQFENDYDEGLIDGRRYRTATEKATARLEPIQREMNQMAGGAEGAEVLTAEDPVAAFDAASMDQRRRVIDALMTVTLMPAPRGKTDFDPATVDIAWNHGD